MTASVQGDKAKRDAEELAKDRAFVKDVLDAITPPTDTASLKAQMTRAGIMPRDLRRMGDAKSVAAAMTRRPDGARCVSLLRRYAGK